MQFILWLVHDGEQWWGAGPTADEARRDAVQAVVDTYLATNGEPPWEAEPGRHETRETIEAWGGGLRTLRVALAGPEEDEQSRIDELSVILGDRPAAELLYGELFAANPTEALPDET